MGQFAVIGVGRFGASLAVTLAKMGHDVLAVDANENKVEEIMDRVTHAVQTDALDEESLVALGVRNFDVVVVAIGQDMQASILATVMLKELGVPTVVAKAQTDLHGRVLARVGADKVVFPERDMGVRVARSLVSRNILDQIDLSPDFSIVELLAAPQFIGRTLAQTAMRGKYGANILAIRRGDEVLISPGADTIIEEGDVLVTIGRTDKLQKLEEF